MTKGTGKIVKLGISGGIATLVLKIKGREIVVHGETRMTLDALTEIFEIAPPPAPPTDVRGKRITYRRDGAMLMSISAAE